jgi:hypothetical protein
MKRLAQAEAALKDFSSFVPRMLGSINDLLAALLLFSFLIYGLWEAFKRLFLN